MDQILDGQKAGNARSFGVLGAGCEEVKELGVFSYLTHVEVDFRGCC